MGKHGAYCYGTLFTCYKCGRIDERQISFRSTRILSSREDIFYRDGQLKPDDPLFTLAFVVSHALSFDEAQQTNKLLATSAIKEQVHYIASALATKGLPKPPGKATKPGNRSCFFCGS